MKKFFIVALSAFALTANLSATSAPAASPTPSPAPTGQYCPQEQICIATNMRAKAVVAGGEINGISIYQVNNTLVADVPGHGKLALYKDDEDRWCFRANGGRYYIVNFSYSL